jgi:hypothetical protein
VLSYDDGIIYRIVPSSVLSSSPTVGTEETTETPLPAVDEQEQDEEEEEPASDGDVNDDDENNYNDVVVSLNHRWENCDRHLLKIISFRNNKVP